MKSPEGYEKDDIEKYLKSIGAWFFRPYMAGFGKSGVPDFVFCYHGRFGAIEVKREGKGPTVIQDNRMGDIQDQGGFAAWGTADKVIPEIKAWIASDFKFR